MFNFSDFNLTKYKSRMYSASIQKRLLRSLRRKGIIGTSKDVRKYLRTKLTKMH